jgi:hypothetical protein
MATEMIVGSEHALLLKVCEKLVARPRRVSPVLSLRRGKRLLGRRSGCSQRSPTEQPYGVRDCAFRDPPGNLIRIQELR